MSKSRTIGLAALLACVALFAAQEVFAQTLPLFSSRTTGNATSYSVPVQTLLLLTAFSFLPAALLLMTSFARIIIVLSLLRQALGLQTTPPNLVLIGLALFLTWFIMNPTFEAIYAQAYAPLAEGKITFEQASAAAWNPLRDFMLAQTRQEDLNLFAALHGKPIPTRAEVPMSVLVPAFAISEIKTGFLVGFMIYLPFIAIDFAVASILTSLGMVMVSPMMFSLPLKLIIFVLADGWALLAASLVASYTGGSP